MNNNFDFRTLKYNLYELLNINHTSDVNHNKKIYLKIIKNFHPDKNSSLEEEIYYHLVIAGKILTNIESKKSYDEYLYNQTKLPNQLKDCFVEDVNEFNIIKISDNEFNNKMIDLDNKHGISDNTTLYDGDLELKLKEIKNNRHDINIAREDIKNSKDFIEKFENKKKMGLFNSQIVEFKGEPLELSSFVIGNSYTNLNNIEKLYIEDDITTDNFSSLEQAFTLQPIIEILEDDNSLETKINNYKSNTNLFIKNKWT